MSSNAPAPGERWTICRLGHVHWGANGGAGLLFRYKRAETDPTHLLAQRTRGVDEPGTWGVPGGAIRDGESAESAARREALEEIGQLPPYRRGPVLVQDCGGGWRFHIILADVDREFIAYCALETETTGWFTVAQMHNLPLHPGVRRLLEQDVALLGH